jgi:acyl dehydratase
LRLESVITAIVPSRSRPDRGIVTVESETKNQRGAVCRHMTAKLSMFRQQGQKR